MKDLFPGYYSPSEDEFKRLWEEGIFVFDANFLLDLYRYSDQTSSFLVNIIKELGDKVWIPYQVCLEYHRNLNSTIVSQVKKYEESIKTILQFRDQIDERRSHPFLTSDLHQEISDFCKKIDEELSTKKDIVKKLLLDNPNKTELARLLENKLGTPFTEAELLEIYNEGEVRYQRKIPPGYLDAKKPSPEKFGDLIIWKEILRKNSTINTPVIFVTNDKKEDWFMEEMKITIGPKPELITEFRSVRNDLVYFYRTDQFIKYANIYLKTPVNAEIVKEIGDIISQSRDDSKSESVSEQHIDENSTSVNQTSSISETKSLDNGNVNNFDNTETEAG